MKVGPDPQHLESARKPQEDVHDRDEQHKRGGFAPDGQFVTPELHIVDSEAYTVITEDQRSNMSTANLSISEAILQVLPSAPAAITTADVTAKVLSLIHI